MNDPRPRDTADPGKLPQAMVEQCIHQSAVNIPSCRMHHKARRLVDDDEMFVLKDDDQRDVLRRSFGSDSTGHGDAKCCACRQLERSLPRSAAIKRNASLAEQGLDPLARQATRHGQRLVEPLTAGRDYPFDDAFPLNHV